MIINNIMFNCQCENCPTCDVIAREEDRQMKEDVKTTCGEHADLPECDRGCTLHTEGVCFFQPVDPGQGDGVRCNCCGALITDSNYRICKDCQ